MSLSIQKFTSSNYCSMPWKNGGGTTLELTKSDDLHSADQLPLWRLSIADVSQDGPFSKFEHYHRTIMLLSGAGMNLSFNNNSSVKIDRHYQMQPFEGNWQTECTLINAAIKDFNLMVDQRRATYQASVTVLNKRNLIRENIASIVLFHCFKGQGDVTADLSTHTNTISDSDPLITQKFQVNDTIVLQNSDTTNPISYQIIPDKAVEFFVAELTLHSFG